MRYFRTDGGDYAACDFVPSNAEEEISEAEYGVAVAAIEAEAKATDDATEEDFLAALGELGVIV